MELGFVVLILIVIFDAWVYYKLLLKVESIDERIEELECNYIELGEKLKCQEDKEYS